MFQKASVWDIPLVKPRFSCVIDISMAVKGYDVAAALEEQLSHFVSGSSCAWGSIHLDPALLRPKAGIEFGYPTGKDMPSISTLNLRVSVVFYSGRSASPTLLDASISSVALRFPEVFEVVVVFTEPPIERAGLEDILNAYIEEAPFAVEVIEEVDGSRHSLIGSRSRWSGLQADNHSSGQFVMQLEVGDILMSDVTYENLFYFGKPVIPYKRLSPGGDVDSSAGGKRSSVANLDCCCVQERRYDLNKITTDSPRPPPARPTRSPYKAELLRGTQCRNAGQLGRFPFIGQLKLAQ